MFVMCQVLSTLLVLTLVNLTTTSWSLYFFISRFTCAKTEAQNNYAHLHG